MPMFMDVHERLPHGATAKDMAEAHRADLEVQQGHGVRYLRYWVDEEAASCSAWRRRRARKPR
jgi:hypothetical protein